jgi:hypothetical protein
MIKIQRELIDRLHAANTGQDLHDLVQGAIRLEHSTIPPYLTAMLSLKPEQNREIWSIIHSVVIDEMLHMTITCNLLNALGKRPQIDDPGFVPNYPGSLPTGIDGDLIVGLEPFSIDLMNRTFMKIEEPEHPIVFKAAAVAEADYATIGQFYRALIDKIRELAASGKELFIGDPARQVMAKDWYAAERLFAIVDADSGVKALQIIIEEGEGTSVSPLAEDGELAHYYRFQEIGRLRRLVPDAASENGYSFSGPVIPFDPAAVYPLTKNQKVIDLDASSEGGRRARQFSFVYTKLLKALQRVFDGEPQEFGAALGLMYELKLAGQILCSLPAIKNNAPTGFNAGPTFEYSPTNA